MAGWSGRTKRTIGLLLGGWWLATLPLSIQAMEARPDVRVIIDVSGSMRVNDPDQLSAGALELLVSLLPEGTPAGVWTFGDRVDNPLPPGRVDDAWRERAVALALAPALVAYQPFTDIEAAVREAAAPESEGRRHLLLLTDGMIDLSPARGAKPGVDDASRRALLETLAPALSGQGVVVHAIAFSGEADLDLVERLAHLTGGLPAQVETPESLLGAFLDIFDRIFPGDQVPLQAGRFVIEPGVESFSALLFHDPDGEPLALVAPDGSVYRADDHPSEMRWQVEPRFDLIRVPNPQPGEWRLEGELADDSRVSVVSPLALRTGELPATLYQGFPLSVEAWIERDGEPTELDALAIRVEVRGPDDEVLAVQRLERRGERFVGELPPPERAGGARLLIRAEAEGFRRQRLQAVGVLPAIAARHEAPADRVLLEAEHPRLNHDNTELFGELGGETLSAEALEARRWQLALPELDDGISRPLSLRARIVLDGETRELALPRLVLNPDAQTALDLADRPGARPDAERFHEDLATGRDAGEMPLNAADRFIAFVNDLPQRIMALWQYGWREGRPAIERLIEAHGRDPRAWMAGAALLLLVLMTWVAVRRRSRRARRIVHREEPHV